MASAHDTLQEAPGNQGQGGPPWRLPALIAACLVAVGVLLAVAGSAGVPPGAIMVAGLAATVVGMVVLAIPRQRAAPATFLSAGQRWPASRLAPSLAAERFSLPVLMAGSALFYADGYDGLGFLLGIAGGYVLAAVLVAPYVHRSGAVTLPGFLALRYGSGLVAWLSLAVAATSVVLLLLASLSAVGELGRLVFDMDRTLVIALALGCGMLLVLPAGAQGGFRADLLACALVGLAVLVPAILVVQGRFGVPLAHFGYGGALVEIKALESNLIIEGLADVRSFKAHSKPFLSTDLVDFLGLAFCLMLGTAAAAQVVMRQTSASGPAAARRSVVWGLAIILVIAAALPATAALAKAQIEALVLAKVPLAELPAWIHRLGSLGLVQICGATPVDGDTVVAACRRIARHPGVLRLQDVQLAPQLLLLSFPVMAELPLVVAVIAGAGLLAAGLAGIAASLATMGVMLAVGGTGATSFDPPRAASIAHARWGMVVVGLASALAAALLEVDLLSLVCWSASIAAAGLFPALVLGIWWRRANAAGCAAGILAGSGIALAYILGTTVFAVSFHETWGGLSDASPVAVRRYAQLKELLSEAEGPMAVALQARLLEQAQAMAGWWGVSNRAAGLFGVPVGFVAIVLVSLMTPRPRREQQVELARLRGR